MSIFGVRPSFFMGMARLFDFGGTLNVYDRSVTPQQADYFAIASDWQAIGDDFRIVLGRVDHERVGGKKK